MRTLHCTDGYRTGGLGTGCTRYQGTARASWPQLLSIITRSKFTSVTHLNAMDYKRFSLSMKWTIKWCEPEWSGEFRLFPCGQQLIISHLSRVSTVDADGRFI